MRSRFRASTVVYAARYAPTADALGSMQPGYAAARHALRGTLLPSQDGADPTAAGLRRQEELVLLLPLGADIAWQDGIYLSPDAARPDYRVAALERYPLAGPYFHRITERMWEGQTLPQAWHSVFSRLSLGAEWMTALELTGDEEKLTDGLLYTAGQLKQLCRQRGEEQRQTAKLWLAGVLSAAGLLIILLI